MWSAKVRYVRCRVHRKNVYGIAERREKTARLHRFPPLRISESRWTLRLLVIVRGTGVHFKGARLFEEITVRPCTTDLNCFGLCSRRIMTYGIFNPCSTSRQQPNAKSLERKTR